MKCSHGGCTTDAVVRIQAAEVQESGDWWAYTNPRPACRYHMATICEENQANIVRTL